MKSTYNMIHLSLAVVLLLSFVSCDIFPQGENSTNQLSINNDLTNLNQRVQIINEVIDLDTVKSSSASDVLLKQNGSDQGQSFVHVANIQVPVDENGNKLSATSIEVRANTIYVSYHLNGSPFGGAVDIIDVNNHENPQIICTVSFTDTDVNALEIEENGKLLWLTGGRDISSSGHDAERHNGAVIGELAISKKEFVVNSYRETPLPSFSGNALVDFGRELFVAAGASDGGFFQLDKENLQIQNSVNTDSAKFIDRRKDDIIGLSLKNGSEASFDMMDFKNGDMKSFNTGLNIIPVNGKNVIEHRAAVTYAALGREGVKGYMFDGNPGPLVFEFNPQGENVTDVANGVSVDGKHVYIAHGTDGLFITTHPRSGQKDPELVFSWKEQGTPASANYVKTDGNFIILANGINGINILRRN